MFGSGGGRSKELLWIRLVMEKIMNKKKASALACMMQAHAYMCMYVRDRVSSVNSVTS